MKLRRNIIVFDYYTFTNFTCKFELPNIIYIFITFLLLLYFHSPSLFQISYSTLLKIFLLTPFIHDSNDLSWVLPFTSRDILLWCIVLMCPHFSLRFYIYVYNVLLNIHYFFYPCISYSFHSWFSLRPSPKIHCSIVALIFSYFFLL